MSSHVWMCPEGVARYVPIQAAQGECPGLIPGVILGGPGQEDAARLVDLPLEATVALAEVAAAIKDPLLAFGSATRFVVMPDD